MEKRSRFSTSPIHRQPAHLEPNNNGLSAALLTELYKVVYKGGYRQKIAKENNKK